MPRSYSKSGCVTCRRRRKKCGEEKPVCNTCLRLGLSCGYSANEDKVPTGASNVQHVASLNSIVAFIPRIQQFASLAPEAAHLGDFHRLPVSDEQRTEVVDLCGRLAGSLMKDVWPFALPQTQSDIVLAGWLVPTFTLGRMILMSCAAIAAGLQAHGETSSRWQLVRSRYQAEALELLRADLDSAMKATAGVSVEFTTLVCAAHIPIVAISYTTSGLVLEKFAAGARTLLKQFGGLRPFVAMKQHHVVQILVRAEHITCMVTGNASEYLPDCDRPVLPQPIRYKSSEMHPAFASICDPVLLRIMQDFRVLLHYRVSNEQVNTCQSLDEYYYLTDLFHHVDLQLTHLQALHRNKRTTQECIVYTLILLRIDTLGDRWLHPKLGDLMSTRYFRAVDQTDMTLWVQDLAVEILMWVLCVGSVLCHEADMQKRCSEKLAAVLPHVFPPRTRGVDFDLCREVETTMWTAVWHMQLSQKLAGALPVEESMRTGH